MPPAHRPDRHRSVRSRRVRRRACAACAPAAGVPRRYAVVRVLTAEERAALVRRFTGAAAREGRARLETLLASLNEPQRRAATHGDGPLLVVAGPGAGKTRVVVARVAHLLLSRDVQPDEITAITFSRRAAGELQSRLARLVGPALAAGESIWAGTFHALGARILRHGGARHFSRPPSFTIYDQDDTERTLRRILAALGVPSQRAGRLATAARQAIALCKRRGAAPEGTVGDEPEAVPLDQVFRRYQAELSEAAAFDFEDLVLLAVQALDRDPVLRAWAQRQARYLLVDEYQDTDRSQEALIRRLAPPPHNVCVVADPQQSIYAFRGAAPEGVERFLQHYPRAAIVRLEQNYRSTRSIVALARRLLAPYARAPSRFTLRLWTANPPGTPARLWVAPHPEKEADAIAADVAAKLGAGWPPDEIAILVRTHAQARPIEPALLRAGVPYVLVGGVRFFAREEIKDALAYLRLAALPDDAAAFWRVVNTPRRGLGPAAMLTIARYALAGGGPVAGARRWAATEGAPDGLYDFLAHLDELAALERSGAGPRAVIEAALKLTRYREFVLREHPDGAQARLEALAELLRIAGQYADTRRFLDEATLAGAEDDPVPATGRVRLSTVHAAKGLEFRAVYVPGCEVGLFPLAGRRGRGADLPGPPAEDAPLDPEERRIFYVALTRAKEELTLSYCTYRREGRTQPSPFLAEIGRGLLRRAKLGSDQPATRRRTRGTCKRTQGSGGPAGDQPPLPLAEG